MIKTSTKLNRIIYALILLFSTSSLVVYFFSLGGAVIRIPYWDQIAWVRDFYARDTYLSYLWVQYVNHRNVFSKLLTSLDLIVSGGNNLNIVLVLQLFWAAMVLIFISKIRIGIISKGQSVISILLIVLLSYSTTNYVFTAYPINVSFLFVTGFALFAFWACFSSGRLFYLTPLFAFLSHVSSVNGMLVWPLILTLDFLRHRAWKRSLYLGASAVIFNIIFFVGFSFQTGASEATVQSGMNFFSYFFQIQGLPLSLAISWPAPGILVGLLFTIIQVVLILHFLITKPQDSSKWQSIAGIVFSLFTCLMIAWGRYDNTPRVGGRYSVFPIFALLNTAVYCMPWLWRYAMKGQKIRTAFLALMCIFTVGFVAVQISFGSYYTKRARDFHDRSDAIIAGQRDSLLVVPIYPHYQEIDSIYMLLEQKGIYMFSKGNR